MPAVACITHSVLSPDGTGKNCAYPMQTTIGEGNSNNVRIGGLAVAVQGNKVAPHPKGGCSLDESSVSTYSSTIRIGGRGIARIGDMLGNNLITQGAATTFGGG